MRKLVLALSIPLLCVSANAFAHFNLTAPSSTTQSLDGGKGLPPCGPDTPSNAPVAVTGGSMLPLSLLETVFHPGFYRVALSINSRSELPADNVVKDKMGNILSPTSNGLADTAEYEATPVFPVLADHLFAHEVQNKDPFQTSIMLPNVTCAKCTLQVIEFMSNHGANKNPDGTASGGFFYHHCADLKITADPNKPIFTPGGTGGVGGAGGGGGGSTAGASSAAGTSGVGAGGTGGVVAGAAGSGTGIAGAAAGSTAAGGASAAGSSAAGSTGTPVATDPGDSGGCSLSRRASGSASFLSVLVGLFVLGRRRRSRTAA